MTEFPRVALRRVERLRINYGMRSDEREALASRIAADHLKHQIGR
jgi:hypothetical protein